MSYRIEYDSRAGKYEITESRSPLAALCISGMLFLLMLSLWPEGRTAFLSWLIPGDDTVTVAAFSAMTDDLRCGAEIWKAVEGFCRAVIHGR